MPRKLFLSVLIEFYNQDLKHLLGSDVLVGHVYSAGQTPRKITSANRLVRTRRKAWVELDSTALKTALKSKPQDEIESFAL